MSNNLHRIPGGALEKWCRWTGSSSIIRHNSVAAQTCSLAASLAFHGRTDRNPMLALQIQSAGSPLYRNADRLPSAALFQPPPRSTR